MTDWRVERKPFTPCSTRHKSCSPWHANLVRGYIEERLRQEIEHDGLWDAYGTGEYKMWKENGGRLITFKEWLIAHKGSGRNEDEHTGHEHRESDQRRVKRRAGNVDRVVKKPRRKRESIRSRPAVERGKSAVPTEYDHGHDQRSQGGP